MQYSDLAFHEESVEPRAHKSLQEYVDQVQKAQKERLFDFSVRITEILVVRRLKRDLFLAGFPVNCLPHQPVAVQNSLRSIFKQG